MSDWTPERHAAAKALCEAATDGPWGYDVDLEIAPFDTDGHLDWSEEVAAVVSSEDDARFITRARTEFPAALVEIEELKGEVGRFKDQLSEVEVRIDSIENLSKKLLKLTNDSVEREKSTQEVLDSLEFLWYSGDRVVLRIDRKVYDAMCVGSDVDNE